MGELLTKLYSNKIGTSGARSTSLWLIYGIEVCFSVHWRGSYAHKEGSGG